MKNKIWLLSMLFAAGLLFPFSSASGQSSLPEMQVTPFFDGHFKYGEWLPLQVELENEGQDIEAEVQVRVQGSKGGITYSALVSLPSGAHKRITLYILPNNYSHSLDVNLISGEEVLVSKKAAIHPMMNINVMVGLAAPKRQALSLLNGVEYPNNSRPVEVIDMSLDQLPERVEGLSSFDILIFNDIDTSQLTPAQLTSLQSWVYTGGRLVLGGGVGAGRTFSGLPEDLLPIKLDGEKEVLSDDLDALAKFADAVKIDSDAAFVRSNTLLTNGTALAGDDENPLISEYALGSGFVDFIAIDLSGKPFDGWTGTIEFWETLLQSREDYYNLPSDMSERSLLANNFIYPLSNIQSMELPSVKWLAVILGIYIVLIGPVNYFLLKRKNRLHLAWLSIPAITLLFSAAAFGSGYLMRGNNILINKIGIIEIQSDEYATLSSYMGLFSPSQTSYQVEVPADSLLSPMMDEYNITSSAATIGETKLVQSDPAILEGLNVNQWSMQSFMTEQAWHNLGSIEGVLVIKNSRLVGKITNQTSRILKDATVILANNYQRLGDLAPGQSANLDIDLATSVDQMNLPVFYRMYDDEEEAKTSLKMIELKRSILSNIFDNGMISKLSSRVVAAGITSAESYYKDVLVFGWIDQFPPEVTVSSNSPAIQSTGLLYTYLDYLIPSTGPVHFPPGIISGNIIETDAGQCGSYNSTSFYMERGRMAEVEYQLPPTDKVRYSEIDLHLWLDMAADMSTLELSLYDWHKEQWTRFNDLVTGTNIVRKPEGYINDDGSVRVMLNRSNEGVMNGCVYLELGFIGQGKGGKQ